MLDFTIKRGRRKTLAAYVLDDGTVEVRAPFNLSRAEIDRFVAEREKKLQKYVFEQLKKREKRNSFAVEIGSEILFLGKPRMIKLGTKTQIRDQAFYVTEGSVKNQVTALYKSAAERIIKQRTDYFAKITEHTPSSVKINSAKSRWGSCSAKGALNFSWFLIMAEPRAVDYVIIHELSHIAHMDHSEAFWAEVARYEPDYKRLRKTLAALSARLQTEDW